MKQLSILLLLAVSSNIQAQTETTEPVENMSPVKTKIEPGMSAELAIKMIGRQPDETEMVGAACGVFEVLTWHGEKARVVTMGGNVISRD